MKLTNCSIRQFAGLALLLALAGCQTAPARVELQRVNVPVPVACDEPVPERPVMPTEQLRPGATVDQFTQAAQAEIERREGYEARLLAALISCTQPVRQ
ncbi:hypothetical protein [Delftia tsuruhatensis]|jgi:hypothetical protein|uniref:Lipoprotein n=1 Tax=Delftia tsuruhatensis TaxID=180282 RepID=A0AAX3SGQ8_9BURK|nr:hypothetical protein [Delftia tsuruhatensis]WFF79267.1 hypothetical protein PYR84_20270 [Delftia tsuruhatensis]